MEFNELIANFATRHNVPDLEVQDGVTALNIDEILVSIVSLGDVLTISADIGEQPTEGAEVFANILLEANLRSDAFFARNPENENYIIVRRLSLLLLDDNAFDDALESLVNQVEVWRRLLADFRPVAKAKAEHAEEEEPPSFDSNGFLRV